MFLELFINHIRHEKRYSQHTVTAYEHDLQQFFLYLNPEDAPPVCIHPANITHHHVRGWMVSLVDRQMSPRTVGRKIVTLRKYFKFLLSLGHVTQNPAVRVVAPKVAKVLPVVVDSEELTGLLDNSKHYFTDDFNGLRDKLVIEMLFGTGIRLAELLNLREPDIDFYHKTIKVLGKRNKQRMVPLNAELIRLIKQYIEEKKNQNFDNNSLTFIVTNKGAGAYPKLIYLIVQKYLSYITTQDKRSPHILRHTFATTLLNNGADLNAIKELLGHASLAATQVYTHNSVERLKSIYKQAHPKA